MMDERAISIIVPMLNESRSIGDLLHDLQPMRQRGVEVVCVDGGSDDATPTCAEGKVDRLISSPPGRALQMNAGVETASGRLLWFLHADTRVASGALDAIIHCVAGGHHWGRFDVRLSGERRLFRVVERLMNLRSCISGIATGDQGIFVTRDHFDGVGGFPVQALMEDIEISRRLKRLARPACVHHPRLVTSSRRWEQRGPLRTILLMWQLRLSYWLGAAPELLARRYP